MNELARLIAEKPKLVLAALGLLMLACIPMILQIQADSSISSFLPRGHASYDQKLAIQHLYSINDPIFVDVYDRRSGDILSPEGLKAVQRVSRFVEDLPGIRPGSVRSLDTFEDIRASEGGFEVQPFLDPLPATQAEAQALRERVRAFPVYDGLLLSQDGTRAGIIGDFEETADVLAVFAAVEELRAGMEREGDFGIRLSGPPIVTGTLNVYLNQDALRLDPVVAVLTSILLFLSLRSFLGVMLPLTVMLPAIAVAATAMPLLGYDFTPYSNAIPVVVLAAGIADSVHFLSDYYDIRIRQPKLDAKGAVVLAYQSLWAPIMATSITTAVGFLLMIIGSPMMPVHEFGVIAAIGIMAALLFSLTVLPACVVLTDAKPSAAYARLYATTHSGAPGGWYQFTQWGMGRLFDNPPLAGGFLIAVALIGTLGIARLFPDYDPVTFFPRDSNVYQDFHAVSDGYVGVNVVELDIDTGQEDGVYEPGFLNRLAGLQDRIESWAPVGGTLSIADYLKKMNQAFHADDPAEYRIADSTDANAQLFLLYDVSGDPRRFDEVTDDGRSRANLRIFLKAGNYARSGDFVRWLERESANSFPEAKVALGGETYVVYHWMKGVERDVLVAIAISALCMAAIGIAYLGSLVGGLLMLAPILIGLVLTYAWIGFSGVGIGLGTSAFASIAMGIGVDFAIHYLWRYREERRGGLDHAAATARVIADLGKVIIFNGLIVTGGFFVLILSTTTPAQQTGTYVAISVGASLATTFIILSVATRWWRVARIQPLETGTADAR